MTKQEQFFYDESGYSYDPKTETQEQGHERCAKQLAEAERWAMENNLLFEWAPDTCIGGDCEPCCHGPHPDCWLCMAWRDDVLVASLGSVCLPTMAYRRVVEAELALEAMDTLVP